MSFFNRPRFLALCSCLVFFLACLPVAARAEGPSADAPTSLLSSTATDQSAEQAGATKKKGKLFVPKLPVGSIKAPAVQTSKDAASSANLMLMQGLRTSLQKSGQNPDLPKSVIPATDLDNPAASDAVAVAQEEIKTPVPSLKAPMPVLPAPKTEETAAKTTSDTGLVYEAGHAPKSLAAPVGAMATEVAPLAATETIPAASVPKATDIKEEPKSLLSKVKESIFGAPVSDTKKEEPVKSVLPTPAAATEEAKIDEKKIEAPCAPSVTAWVKTCEEAGYPAGYTGSLSGETRVSCPGPESRDVWLANTCSQDTKPSPKVAAASAEPSTSVAEPEEDVSESLDANCGAANGLPTKVKPIASLCATGKSQGVTGEGPWFWDCKGGRTGMVVSCAAPKAEDEIKKEEKAAPKVVARSSSEDGKCGAANGQGYEFAPQDELCAKGIPSRVNGGGPWTWACSGVNGGSAAACEAARKADGVCGAATATPTGEMPQKDLCQAGIASAVNGSGPWSWTCSGLYGGKAASCSVAPVGNAVCGVASLKGHKSAPDGDLCAVGKAGSVDGSGPWTWTCEGKDGGASVSCQAAASVDGVCGGAHGSAYKEAPESGLCQSGNVTRVTGNGPWSWSCIGIDGGNTSGCAASVGTASAEAVPAAKAVVPATQMTQAPTSLTDMPETKVAAVVPVHDSVGVCGTAANVVSLEKPESNLCSSGSAGSVKKEKGGYWVWKCDGGAKGSVQCYAPASQGQESKSAAPSSASVKCGASDGLGMRSIPTSGLCETGKASRVQGSGPWTWMCSSKSGERVDCSAPLKADAVCGLANGSIRTEAPTAQLCERGSPTPVAGNGPWSWSCVGVGGGNSISCSANAQSLTRVDGVCGASANASMMEAPTANLCDGGMASRVYGEGPWTWTCSGLNGGIASTCTTSKVVPHAPPPPAASIDAMCGAANGVATVSTPSEGLCAAGTVTGVSGSGPWNWNCLGSNGGMTVSCTAPLMPPAPISGVCGSANGVPTGVKPKAGLCSGGIASAVSGKGPWTWSCSGVNGGGAVSCVAPFSGKDGGALPSLVMPGRTTEAPVPQASPVGLVTPQLTSDVVPPMEKGALLKSKPSKTLMPPAGSDLLNVPAEAPELPTGTQPLPPPDISPDVPKVSSTLLKNNQLTLPEELSVITFESESSKISDAMLIKLSQLSSFLLGHAETRVTLTSSADNANSTPRAARRLSLNRALAVRDFLSERGISNKRIDIRAVGANVHGGNPDRIDVTIN